MQSISVEAFRVSPQQKRLWLLQRGDQITPYRTRSVIKVEGLLNTRIFKAALQNVINRHEILRTTFKHLNGENLPRQIVSDMERLLVQEADLSGRERSEQEALVDALYQQQERAAFDFDRGPLIDARLVKLSSNEHLFLLDMSALCADRHTIANLVEEIGTCYEALLTGGHTISDAMQYADLSEWQNEMLEMEEAEAGKRYWVNCLSESLLSLDMPFAQTTERTFFKPSALTVGIDDATVSGMRKLTDEKGVSEYTFLLACLQVLMWRVTGQPEGVVGAAFDGRRSEEVKGALGLFAKFLPIKYDLGPGIRFADMLSPLSASLEEASRWQEFFSWGEAEASQPRAAEPPFFPVCFDYERRPESLSAAGLSFTICRLSDCIDRFKIKIHCIRNSDSLLVEFSYDENSFATEDVTRFAGWFKKLIESAVTHPQARVVDLEVLSLFERAQILYDWNETIAEYPKDKCFHHLFEEQARKTPQNVALVFEDRELTYAELNARANRLAHKLIRMGVGPDVIAGICVERSFEMIVGLLAILKAGGAYMPLDRMLPLERLSFMLEDAQPPVLLAQERLLEQLPSHWGEVVCLDADIEGFDQECEENPSLSTDPDNLAYVIYTSGSTGKPKGVMISHKGLVNYLTWATTAYRVADGEGAPVHSSIAFDLPITSLFSPLLTGGAVKLLGEGDEITSLCEEFESRRGYSLVKLTPAHLDAISRLRIDSQAPTGVRALIIGGESLSRESLGAWRSLPDGPRLINEYGPTETVVGCCTYEVPPDELAHGAVPIGRPIANTQIYLLDANLGPVGVGMKGEIYIGGEGLGRGYINQPARTAERFIPNPFSRRQGDRLYKTGDNGRFLADGNIEFLGRTDSQVKINGFRIELEEITSVLSEQASLRDAVVLAQERGPGDKRLIAYLVASSEARPSVTELRESLAKKLPAYMLPSHFVFLDKLPLTRNGKVDREALPTLDIERSELYSSFAPPRTPLETSIAEIWAATLGVKEVGIHDHFFDLGGHSLLATQIVSRIRDGYEIDIPLSWFFTEEPTVAKLCEAIQEFFIEQAGADDLASTLAELNELSDEEVKLGLKDLAMPVEQLA